MKKIYIAGKLNDDAVGYIKNIHRMIKTAKQVRNAGFAVYVPCNDILEGIVDGKFSYDDYFNNSQPWLESSNAIFLTPGWKTSKGTQREIKLAKSKNIPVFSNLKRMIKYFKNEQTCSRSKKR